MKKSEALLRMKYIAALPWIFLIVTLVVLLIQAHHPWWRLHLEADIGVFLARSGHFFSEGTWKNMGFNEYPPGALWLFVLLQWMTFNPQNHQAMLAAVIFFNTILVVFHFLFFHTYGYRNASLVFLAIILAMGPILIFRFELAVSLLVLYSWKFFQEKKLAISSLLLGLGTCIKLYPIVLLPLIIGEAVRNRKWPDVPLVLLYFCIGLLAPVTAMTMFGASLTEIISQMQVQSLRHVETQVFWASVIGSIQHMWHIPIRTVSEFNDNGLLSDLPFLQDYTMNVFTVGMVGLLLCGFLQLSRKHSLTNPLIPFLLLFAFIFFSRTGGPQYRWWFIAFLPWIAPSTFGWNRWLVIIILTVVSLMLSQIVYPIFYDEFLSWFRGENDSPWIFSISVIRNVLQFAVLLLTVASVPWFKVKT